MGNRKSGILNDIDIYTIKTFYASCLFIVHEECDMIDDRNVQRYLIGMLERKKEGE